MDPRHGVVALGLLGLLLAGCGEAPGQLVGSDPPASEVTTEPSAVEAADGRLDCVTDLRWEVEAARDAEVAGFDTVEEAIQAALGPFLHPGDTMHIAGRLGTIVRDGREVVRVTVDEWHGGGYVDDQLVGCEGAEAVGGPFAYTCAGLPFVPEDVLSQNTPAEARDGEVYDALRFHLDAGTAFGEYPDGPWYELGVTDGRAEFFAEYVDPSPDGPLGVYLVLENADGAWEWAGAGECTPTVHHPALGPATWVLDGTADGSTTTFTAFVTERACASGQPSGGRIDGPVVTYRQDTVVVTFLVDPLDGDQTCPDNPATSVEVTLDEPLGDRELLDGGVWPPRPPIDAVSSSEAAEPHDPAEEATDQTALREDERALLDAFVQVARTPSEEAPAPLRWADSVSLHLADGPASATFTPEEATGSVWSIEADLFRAYTGPFDPLALIAETPFPLTFGAGPHPHCASPPVPVPADVQDLRRLWIQPEGTSSCLEWFTVDLFLDDAGAVTAVSMDLWEP